MVDQESRVSVAGFYMAATEVTNAQYRMFLESQTASDGYAVRTKYTVPAYFPNDFGLYNMSGNVAEMVQTEGISKGGSWRSGAYDIRIDQQSGYEGSSPALGFRPVLQIKGVAKKDFDPNKAWKKFLKKKNL
jgi:formylglycine-generating enzyme required for sulfatase activity